MRNMFLVYAFIFFALAFTRASAYTCECPSDRYPDVTDLNPKVWTQVAGYGSELSGEVCFYSSKYGYEVGRNKTFVAGYGWINEKYAVSCHILPTCVEPLVPDTSVYPAVCAEPAPTCPAGQHDDLSNPEAPNCVCDSGYPTYDFVTNEIKECVLPTCPLEYDSLPLKLENVSIDDCYNIFPVRMGWDTFFLPDPNTSLTCCYSDGLKDTPDAGECDTNQIKDLNGDCQDIPSNDPDPEDNNTEPTAGECAEGTSWNGLTQQCSPVIPPNTYDDTPTDTTEGGEVLDENGNPVPASDAGESGTIDFNMPDFGNTALDKIKGFDQQGLDFTASGSCSFDTFQYDGDTYDIGGDFKSAVETHSSLIASALKVVASVSAVILILSGGI